MVHKISVCFGSFSLCSTGLAWCSPGCFLGVLVTSVFNARQFPTGHCVSLYVGS